MTLARPYLDYYNANGVIPVKQDISDLPAHFRRRAMLYHFLHVPPGMIRGKRVLEIGPGTGDNAIYTAALKPQSYTLIDGNRSSIAALKTRIANPRYRFNAIPQLEYHETDFLLYEDRRKYDLVICEGLLQGQDDPPAFLERAASFVADDGMLIITTQSAASILAEVCRRALRPIFFEKFGDTQGAFDAMVAFFRPHLDTVQGRSRVVRDWVTDTIYRPWPKTIAFPMDRAIAALGERFNVYGTSPQFAQDFRWYKGAAADTRSLNDRVIEQLAKWSPLFIDYRIDPVDYDWQGLGWLESECYDIFLQINEAWETSDVGGIVKCLARLGQFGDSISYELQPTAKSIYDFSHGAQCFIKGDMTQFGSFASWFGRCQQYVSFLRVS